MTAAENNDDLEALAPAWREFQSLTPVKLRAVENERHYRAMVNFMNKLVDEIGDRESHHLMGLLDIVTFSCATMRSTISRSPQLSHARSFDF